jgi:periplasmic divalent cation tolerance protein
VSETITFVTCTGTRRARTLARTLVRERLAACVNLLPGVTSIYAWAGKVETANEVLLVIKSRSALVKRLCERVLELHTYSVPEVVTVPIVSGNPAYLRWIRESTR